MPEFLRRIVRYTSYVLRHKWFVLLECWRRGLIWRGLVHDLSKLRPSEFFAYANYFGRTVSRPARDDAFNLAWLRHQKRNDHHWEWWVMPRGITGYSVLPMSCAARREMVADWIACGRAQGKVAIDGKPEVLAWYIANRDRMLLHPETRRLVEIDVGYEEAVHG